MKSRGFCNYLLPLVALVTACGGNSCGSCTKPIPGGFPVDARHENAVQVRVSQSALNYLETNGGKLVGSLLPGGKTTFDVPASCGKDPELCCDNGMPGKCTIDINVQHMTFNPVVPDTLNFIVTATLKTTSPIIIKQSLATLGSTCLIDIDTSAGKKHQAIDLGSSVKFSVDGSTKLTSIALGMATIMNLDPDMITIKGKGFLDFGCGLTALANSLGLVQGALQGAIGGQLSGAVGGALCAKCKTQADCSSLADSCSMGGQCMKGMNCIQEVGIAGRMDFGSLLGKFSGGAADVDLYAVLGGYAEVTGTPGGISLGMLGGGRGGPHSNCVPMRPSPTPAAVPKWAEEMGQMFGEVDPAQMKPYHVGIGIHESELNQIAWAAFDGGALCLNIGASAVPQLDAATIGVLIPSLAELTHTRDSPMYIVLRPQQEPHITLGAGTFDVDMSGKKTIKDPLMNVSLPQLAVDFYGFVDERYVRVMTLNADVTLPVSLDADDKGQIVPMLGDLSKAFNNVTVTNSELLSENPTSLARAFPTLLGAASGALGNIKPIALPAVMGIKLKLVGIEPTDSMKFLSIFAAFDLATPDAFHARTLAEVVAVHTPPTEEFSVTSKVGLDPARQPSVELQLGGVGVGGDDHDLEWSVNVDDTTWSPYSQARHYQATNSMLWLQGRHNVQVRARVVGDPNTTDPEPQRFEFLVDTIAPTGSFDVIGGQLVVSATDLVSPPDALVYSVRLPGAGWSNWTSGSPIAVAGAAELADAVEVRARDEAGNIGAIEFHGRTTTPSTGKGGCGCTVGGRSQGPGGWPLLSFVMLVGLLLRRNMRGVHRSNALLQRNIAVGGAGMAIVIAAGLASLGASGCNGDAGTMMMKPSTGLAPGDLLDPANMTGRYSDAAALSGVIHLSAYNDNYEDLAYAEVAVADVGKPIQWQWADGVPVDQAPDMPGGPRNGISDSGDDVGQYSSIALDAMGNPHIAYYDVTHGALKYASAIKRKFTATYVDMPAMGKGQAGLYTSISLDAGGIPSIAYAAINISDGAGGFVSKLRIATAASAKPAGPMDWKIVEVDSSSVPCAGLCAKSQYCVVADAMKNTSVCKAPDAAACPAACVAPQVCVGGGCVSPLVAAKAVDLVEGTGLFAQLLRSPMGARAITYYDREQGDLKLAVEASGSFAVSFIDGKDPATDVGQFAASTYAPDGTLHVAYVDAISDRLLYRTVTAGKPSAMAEVIDDGMRMDQKHSVGAGAAIYTDGKTVTVVYQDQRTSDLWIATRGAMGWTKQASKMGAPGYGFYPHIVADGGKTYLTEFVYDRSAQTGGMPLGSLAVTALP